MDSAQKLAVAAVQMQGKRGDIQYNLGHVGELAEQAFKQGARLVALPEFFTSPVMYDEPFDDCIIDADNNHALAMLRELAKTHQGYVGGSGVIRVGEAIYNRYYFVEPDGTTFTHDKDLPTMWENCFYEGGQDDGLMRTSLGGVGAAVCWELIRTGTIQRLRNRIKLAVTGTHWWNIPFNWSLVSQAFAGLGEINQKMSVAAPSRFAKALGVPVIQAAHSGRFSGRFLCVPGTRLSVKYDTEFVGATQIVDARGNIIAKRDCSEGPGIVSGEVLLEQVAPSATVNEKDFWYADLPLFHKAYWHQQNLCGKAFYRFYHQGRKRVRAAMA